LILLSVLIFFSQDIKLKQLVDEYNERFDIIAKHFPDRSDIQCQQRWQKVVNPELVKGPWTKEVMFRKFIIFATYIAFTVDRNDQNRIFIVVGISRKCITVVIPYIESDDDE
jgi:hypothetical protein